MIKYDALRYVSHGAEIKKDLDEGKNFFKTGREHFTKYLPPRIVALIFYIFDIEFYEDFEEKKINTGIYKPYLYIQCFVFYLSLIVFFYLTKNIFSTKYLFIILLFFSLEPNILQYHGTFWSESYFFAFQIIIIGLMLYPKKRMINYFLIGFFVGILSLQKQYAIYFSIPLIIYFFIFYKKNFYFNILILLVGFFITQFFVGYNNYKRAGVFYFLANDNNIALHLDLVPKVINEVKGYSGNEFVIKEAEEMKKWMAINSIKYEDKPSNKYHYMNYRDNIINEIDKLKFDEEIKNRTLNYVKEYPIEFLKKIINHGFHITLLNPFHIYSDHNFKSGEIYYVSKKHAELIKYRVGYTLIIYLICLYGLLMYIKERNYKMLTLLFLSIFYFYLLSFWHGNTRYYMPVYIYFAFLFAKSFVSLTDRFNFKLK